MSLPEARQTGYTIDDWATWEGRWELINGVPHDMTPAPGFEHQEVSMDLSIALGTALQEDRKNHGSLCRVVAAPVDLFLPGEQSVYQPDLVVVCDPAKVTPRGVVGVPDLVVEILSPSTSEKDMTEKRWAYEQAGIPEYLIVAPLTRAGMLLRLQNGKYEEVARIKWGALVALLGDTVSITLCGNLP